jgi:hypothetical protein
MVDLAKSQEWRPILEALRTTHKGEVTSLYGRLAEHVALNGMVAASENEPARGSAGFGPKVGRTTPRIFVSRIREPTANSVSGHRSSAVTRRAFRWLSRHRRQVGREIRERVRNISRSSL